MWHPPRPAACLPACLPMWPQVEATKFTEVGFHGRDVDQIIRDLVDNAIIMMRQVGGGGMCVCVWWWWWGGGGGCNRADRVYVPTYAAWPRISPLAVPFALPLPCSAAAAAP